MLPLSAKDRIKKIKKSIRGDDSFISYTEHQIMKEYSVGYNELLRFPFKKYLDFMKIISLEKKEEAKKKKEAENEAESVK